MWGWVGDPDPISLLYFFTSEQIGGSSDSYYSNPRYDELFELQRAEADQAQRHEIPRRDAAAHLRRGAVPHPLLRLGAARVPDRQVRRLDEPAGGERHAAVRLRPVRLHEAGRGLARAEPRSVGIGRRPESGRDDGTASPAPSGSGEEPASSSSNTILLLAGVAALVAVLAVGFVALRRRSGAQEEE